METRYFNDLTAEKAPKKLPVVKLMLVNEDGSPDRWRRFWLTLSYNYAVNKGIKDMFKLYGAAWLALDFDILDLEHNSPLTIAATRFKSPFKLPVPQYHLWTHGFSTTYGFGQRVPFMQDYYPTKEEQGVILTNIWIGKIQWLRMEYRVGPAFRSISKVAGDLAIAFQDLGLTLVGASEAFKQFNKLVNELMDDNGN